MPTSEELLDGLRRLGRDLGETPTAGEMNELGEYWASQYQDHFGSWNRALEEAGFEPNQHREIPTDELLQAIRRLAHDINKTPTKKQMDERGEFYGQSYRKKFGSWNEAVREAGLEPNQRIPESEFQEEPDTCPLCDESPDRRLDFHHWRYGEDKVGCYLCRDCHDAIHAGGARPGKDVDWLLKAVENLIRCHAEHHEEAVVDAIVERYNLPTEGLVEYVISDVE